MKALVQWVVDDKQAFQVVEKASLKNLFRKLNMRFKVPTRRTLVRGLGDEYEVAEEEFRKILESVPGRVALTCDGWSSRVMRGYFVVTVHWIDSDWAMRSAVLEFTYFPPPHNTTTTADLIIAILDHYKLSTKVRAITTDSGSEMPPAMKVVMERLNDDFDTKLSEDWHIRCACHIMDRAVIDCEALVKKETAMVRDLLKTIRNSTPLRVAWKQIQIRLGREQKDVVDVPNLDVETRWNSMFIMIDACYGELYCSCCSCQSDY